MNEEINQIQPTSQGRKNFNPKIIGVVILLVAAGCNSSQPTTQQTQLTSNINSVPITSLVSTSENTELSPYVNSDYGYSISVPKDWTTSQGVSGSSVVSAVKFNSGDSDKAYMRVYVEQTKTSSLDESVQIEINSLTSLGAFTNFKLLSNQLVTLPDGVSGRLLESSSSLGNEIELVVFKNSVVYSIAGYGQPSSAWNSRKNLYVKTFATFQLK